jgi:hypothetical protein
MKKFLLVFGLFFLAGLAIAQTGIHIPQPVSKSCSSKYPFVKDIRWQKEKEVYIAQFYYKNEPYTARFNGKGVWLDEVHKTSFGELRNNVRDAFSNGKFASWRAYEVNEVIRPNNEVLYRIQIRNAENQSQKYIYYDGKGQLKKEEVI